MKITLDYGDIQKLIKEAYNGVNDMTSEDEEMQIVVDVDSDKFSKKSIEHTNFIQNRKVTNKFTTKDIIPKFEEGAKVDYETLLMQKEIEKDSVIVDNTKKLASETHIPLVKSMEEKNKEAAAKGLMTTGRGTSRSIVSGD